MRRVRLSGVIGVRTVDAVEVVGVPVHGGSGTAFVHVVTGSPATSLGLFLSCGEARELAGALTDAATDADKGGAP